MLYPLSFNTKEEHIVHIKMNTEFYKSVLLEDETIINGLVQEKLTKNSTELVKERKLLEEQTHKLMLEKQLIDKSKENYTKLQEENELRFKNIEKLTQTISKLNETNVKLQEQNSKQKELLDLSDKKVGEHSMYKGKYNEEFTHMCLEDYFGDNFIIEGKGQTHCMDKRMVHKYNNYTIGIECKNKEKITAQDIDKFRKDKITNKFNGCVFISTCQITNIVEIEDDFNIINDELYIYSKNKDIITRMIKLFVNYIETDKDESKMMYLMGEFKVLYRQWMTTKKSIMQFDKLFWTILKNNGIEFSKNGDLFLTPLSKCKSNKIPYS